MPDFPYFRFVATIRKNGIVLLSLLMFAGRVGQWLPTSALAGIIIASAVNLLDPDILAWARRRRTRLDAAVALLSSVRLLQQIAARLEAHGGELLFCEVREDLGLGRDVERTLRKLSLRPGRLNVKTFAAADQALEYAENALLNALGLAPTLLEQRLPLEATDLCREMKPAEVAALAAVLRPRELAGGERLFAAGDLGSELYLVLRGRVDIRLPAAA